MKKVFICADGSPSMGLGHLYRSFAMAQILSDTHDVTLLTRSDPRYIESKYFSNTIIFGSAEPQSTLDLRSCEIKRYLCRDSTLVLDGYHYGTKFQSELKHCVSKLVCVDDFNQYAYEADAVIHPSLSGLTLDFSNQKPSTQLHLGPKYALLRPEIIPREVKGRGRDYTFLVGFGGSDPRDASLAFVKATDSLPEHWQFHVLIGRAYINYYALLDEAKQRPNITIHRDITTEDYVELLSSINFGIVSASTMYLEFATSGLISLAVQLVDNQTEVARAINTLGMGDVIACDDVFKPRIFAQKILKFFEDLEHLESLNQIYRSLFTKNFAQNLREIFKY